MATGKPCNGGGSGFINHDTAGWWRLAKTLLFARSRSCHKNNKLLRRAEK
ncbi:MAG: hypothetical protein LBG27_08935 [Spirochaetaceae bacterium]|jgi:hypothetical protein|nr:hypothetical protein [Spirochaetaceae bacterium]